MNQDVYTRVVPQPSHPPMNSFGQLNQERSSSEAKERCLGVLKCKPQRLGCNIVCKPPQSGDPTVLLLSALLHHETCSEFELVIHW